MIAQLSAFLDHRLTLISAPAGFGKTTLVAEWAAENAGQCAWLALDEGDNDPVRFLNYLIAALQTFDASLGEGVLDLIKTSEIPKTEEVLTLLINQIHDLSALDAPLVLVLDDYHHIREQRIHDAIVYLIDNLPPLLRLIIVTRADPPFPIARLRGRGQLAELRQADLSFSEAEAVQFLSQVMGLDLTPEDVSALNQHTEGWVAGLQMAAISIRGMDDTAGFIKEFTGSNRFILDYLVEEVMDRQPEHIQVFLLSTSVLERMCAQLCDEVLGWTETDGEGRPKASHTSREVLDHLERENLFIVPLDDHREWFRYHHLFAELLRQRLAETHPGESAKLHRRASSWYQAQVLYPEAIHHALEAGEFKHAVDLIEGQAESFLMRGEFTTLLSWCDALPDDERRSRPVLRAYYALATMLSGKPLHEIEISLGEPYSDKAVDEIQEELLLLHAILAFFKGDVKRTVDLSMNALESLPEDRLVLRGLAARILGTAHLLVGDMAGAAKILEQDVQISLREGDQLGAVTGLQRLAVVRAIQGDLHGAHKYYRMAVDRGMDSRGRRLLVSVKALAGLADILREWNKLKEAEYYALESIRVSERFSIAYGVPGYLILARIRQAQGDYQEASRVMADAMQLALDYDATELDDVIVAAYQARLHIMTRTIEPAVRWSESRNLAQLSPGAKGVDADLARRLFHMREIEDMAYARLCLARDAPDHALFILNSLHEQVVRFQRWGNLMEVLLLQSRAHQAQGDLDAALGCLGEALKFGETQDYRRIFLDEGEPIIMLLYEATRRSISQAYAGGLLADYDPDAQEGVEELHKTQDQVVEPLSEREIEVLQWIAEGLTNREIAQKLYLSTSTVKAHTYHIYGKLNVHSRTQAVARARALGVLTNVARTE